MTWLHCFISDVLLYMLSTLLKLMMMMMMKMKYSSFYDSELRQCTRLRYDKCSKWSHSARVAAAFGFWERLCIPTAHRGKDNLIDTESMLLFAHFQHLLQYIVRGRWMLLNCRKYLQSYLFSRNRCWILMKNDVFTCATRSIARFSTATWLAIIS